MAEKPITNREEFDKKASQLTHPEQAIVGTVVGIAEGTTEAMKYAGKMARNIVYQLSGNSEQGEAAYKDMIDEFNHIGGALGDVAKFLASDKAPEVIFNKLQQLAEDNNTYAIASSATAAIIEMTNPIPGKGTKEVIEGLAQAEKAITAAPVKISMKEVQKIFPDRRIDSLDKLPPSMTRSGNTYAIAHFRDGGPSEFVRKIPEDFVTPFSYQHAAGDILPEQRINFVNHLKQAAEKRGVVEKTPPIQEAPLIQGGPRNNNAGNRIVGEELGWNSQSITKDLEGKKWEIEDYQHFWENAHQKYLPEKIGEDAKIYFNLAAEQNTSKFGKTIDRGDQQVLIVMRDHGQVEIYQAEKVAGSANVNYQQRNIEDVLPLLSKHKQGVLAEAYEEAAFGHESEWLLNQASEPPYNPNYAVETSR